MFLRRRLELIPTASVVEFLCFRDKRPDGTLPTMAKVFDTSVTPSAWPTIYPLNSSAAGRYQVIYDKIIVLDGANVTQSYYVEFMWKKPFVCVWDSSVGDYTVQRKNAIYLVLLNEDDNSDQTTVNRVWLSQFMYKIRFTDM